MKVRPRFHCSSILAILVTLSVSSCSTLQDIQIDNLPNNYQLRKNKAGQFYVTDEDRVISVDPSVLSIGYNNDHIVACKAYEGVYPVKTTRIVVNLRTGVSADVFNNENWEYLLEVVPNLNEIKLSLLTSQQCP